MKKEMTLDEIRGLREELDGLAEKGHLTSELQQVRAQLVAAETEAVAPAAEGAR
jgi:hypothetical protein